MTPILVVCVVALALLGAPLFAVMALGIAVAYGSVEPAIDYVNVFIMMGDLQDKAFLLPIPLFTIAGYLMARSGTPTRLVALAEAFFGWIPGGVAIVTVCTCAFFTTFTGASGVTIIALGGLLYPILLKQKYPEPFALGLMTTSGSIGLLFFPALPVFIFATVYSLSSGGASTVDPAELFLGGIFPGLLMVGLLCAYAFSVGLMRNIERIPFRVDAAWAALKGAVGEILLPIAILALLQTGKVSINEIASFTAVYVFVLVVVVYRDIKPGKALLEVVRDAMVLVGAIIVILSVVLGMNNYLTHAEIPQRILAAMREYITSPLVFLAVLNVFLLIIGCLMDIFSAIVAVLPLLIPLAIDFGIDPVHLGVIFLANLEIGYMTPPVGMNLFLSSFQFEKPVLTIYRSVLPFLGVLAVAVLIITYVPALSTWLPEAMGARTAQATPAAAGAPDAEAPSNKLLDAFDDDDLDALLEDEPEEGTGDGAGEGGTKPAAGDLLDELEDDDLEGDDSAPEINLLDEL